MSGGYLDLDSPWAREAVPPEERDAIRARIRDGYIVDVGVAGNRRSYGVAVLGITPRTLLRERQWHPTVMAGIDRAIAWIDEHDTATYAGVEVPVR